MPRVSKISEEEKQAKEIFLRQVGERIKAARLKKGWEQPEFARRMGVTKASVSGWESGITDVQISRLKQIARVLGVKIASLYPEESEDESENIKYEQSLNSLEVRELEIHVEKLKQENNQLQNHVQRLEGSVVGLRQKTKKTRESIEESIRILKEASTDLAI